MLESGEAFEVHGGSDECNASGAPAFPPRTAAVSSSPPATPAPHPSSHASWGGAPSGRGATVTQVVADVQLRWPSRDDAPIDTRGARIERIDPSPATRAQPASTPRQAPLFEREDPTAPPGAGRLILGDNLEAMRALLEEGLEGKLDLAYLDPPYMSGVDYALEKESTTSRSRSRTHAYGDRWSERADYLDMLWPRLRLVHRLLAPHATIWVQLDHRATFLAHALLDELFGPRRFRNAIVWRRAPPLGRQVQSGQFPRNVDTLIAYARGDAPIFRPLRTQAPIERSKARYDEARKAWFTLAPRGDYTDESIARLDAEGRVHRTASGKAYIKYFLEEAKDGSLMKSRAIDSMWDDVPAIRHVALSERTGYPTQKPEQLLTRIVQSTCKEGGVVLDPFSGSGTTALVSSRLGCGFIGLDASEVAMETARERLGKAEVPFVCERVVRAAG